MAAEQNSIYSKEGTATSSAVALETAHKSRYDHWEFNNSHTSQVLVVTVKTSGNMTIAPEGTLALDITASPENVTVLTANTTYVIRATGL
jgi:hypothetical protein